MIEKELNTYRIDLCFRGRTTIMVEAESAEEALDESLELLQDMRVSEAIRLEITDEDVMLEKQNEHPRK